MSTEAGGLLREGGKGVWRSGKREIIKLQALVYDILSSTTAVFSYVKGSRKVSATEQCFVGFVGFSLVLKQ